jgi:hypothetical protein
MLQMVAVAVVVALVGFVLEPDCLLPLELTTP